MTVVEITEPLLPEKSLAWRMISEIQKLMVLIFQFFRRQQHSPIPNPSDAV
jgi:hypothetical protein